MIKIDKDFYCFGDYYDSGACVSNACGKPCERESCRNFRRKWPTPEQFREEYGEEYPDDGAVYCKQLWLDDKEETDWFIFSYSWFKDNRGKYVTGEEKLLCICACTPWGNPPEDWKPECQITDGFSIHEMAEKKYKEKLDEILTRLNAATPGPWEWDVNSSCKIARLYTTHSGRYIVMDFTRWGPQSAIPEFQVYDKYEGDVRERGSHGMVRADKLLKSMPGKEHHEGYDDFISHPDADLIANAPSDIKALLEYIKALLEYIKELEGKLNRKNSGKR